MKDNTSISSLEFYNIKRLLNHTEIRNTIIRAYWEGLKHSDLKYGEMVEICRKEFNVSPNLIQRIIARNV
tara:strand:+ start:440 stop:649 length:210 start_codon:yes stop_codon:yes gene_type:complete